MSLMSRKKKKRVNRASPAALVAEWIGKYDGARRGRGPLAYLRFRFDHYCTTACVHAAAYVTSRKREKKGERRRDGARLFRRADDAFRRAIHARCTLFTAPPFFSPPLTTTGETNGIPWTIDIVARANPRRCRLVISIVDREWRHLLDERDFPSGGDTVSPSFFLPLRAFSARSTEATFSCRESYYRARRSADYYPCD